MADRVPDQYVLIKELVSDEGEGWALVTVGLFDSTDREGIRVPIGDVIEFSEEQGDDATEHRGLRRLIGLWEV